jgi:hypothetical protein
VLIFESKLKRICTYVMRVSAIDVLNSSREEELGCMGYMIALYDLVAVRNASTTKRGSNAFKICTFKIAYIKSRISSLKREVNHCSVLSSFRI